MNKVKADILFLEEADLKSFVNKEELAYVTAEDFRFDAREAIEQAELAIFTNSKGGAVIVKNNFFYKGYVVNTKNAKRWRLRNLLKLKTSKIYIVES